MLKRILFTCGMLLSLTLFLLPSYHASAASSQKNLPFVDFSNSCQHISVDSGGVLHAQCKRRDGSTNMKAVLALNAHIGNINGVLTPNKSGFIFSCNGIGGDTTLIAGLQKGTGCKQNNGVRVFATCDLDLSVDNTNGNLVWVSGGNC